MLAVVFGSGCTAAAPPAPTAAPAPPTVAPVKPALVASPSAAASPGVVVSPAAAKPTSAPPPSPSPAASKPTSAPAAQALPTVERSRPPSSAAFLTPAELDLELDQPITGADDLRALVEGMAELNGITHVTSDGAHVSFEYDSTQVLPARIRDRLAELGHPAKAGTEIQSPGDTAD